MTIEFQMLLDAAVLAFVLALVQATGLVLQAGFPAAIGNREGLAEATGWAGRAGRAQRNLLESLVLFAILVIAAHLLEKNSAVTALGARVFLWGRLAHAIVYIGGIPYARTVAWAVSVVGMGMILFELI